MTKDLPSHLGYIGGSEADMTGIGPAGVGTRGASPPDVLAEYRLPRAYRRPFLTRFIVTGAFAALFSYGAVNGANAGFLTIGSLVGVAAVYNGAMYLWRGRFRTRVTTHGIEIHGYFNHFVPWSEVKAVQEEGYGDSQPLDAGYDVRMSVVGSGPRPGMYRRGGGRMTSTTGRRARLGVIRVIRHRGKGVMLRAPLVTAWAPDPYFSDKLRQIQSLSSQYGTRPIGT